MERMTFNERHTMKHEIGNDVWHICKICDSKIQDLAKKYGGCGIYYTKVFITHLEKDHELTPEEYFEKYDSRPLCCEDCNKACKIGKPKSSKMVWKKMCGWNDGIKKWSEEAKTTRKGKGNPMFGKKAWNKGLSTDDPRIEKMIAPKRGVPLSTEHKQAISKAGFKFIKTGKKRGMSGKKHSTETCEKLRHTVLNSIKNGIFKHLVSKPHLKLKEILINLNIEFEEEKRSSFWSFDFYLIKYNIYIEVDGDYFHSNPNTRWPDGPKTITQLKVRKNDINKNQYCKDNNMHLIRFWENDIMKNENIIIENIKWLVQKSKV